MNIYYKERRWNLVLIVAAIITFLLMIWYSNSLIDKIAEDERNKVAIWADAIQRRAKVVAFTNDFFKEVAEEEDMHANYIAKAFKKLYTEEATEDLSFYLEFIADNKTIPCILTDENGKISSVKNIDIAYLEKINTPEKLRKTVFEENYNTIPINYYADKYVYLYYKESIIYTQLREVLHGITQNFLSEIADNVPSLPVIITDASQQNVLRYNNIDSSCVENDSTYIKQLIQTMRSKNEPIRISFGENTYVYVFYEAASILRTLRIFPVIQLFLVIIFSLVAYFLFRFARRFEQDRLWVGMSKETAHQLGTPISSLMAWSELLENENINPDIVKEINKDITRLENITQRFSKIGSVPKLKVENINLITIEFISYFQSRVSSSIVFETKIPNNPIYACISKHLFEWVLENLYKNAVDAMNGVGTITVLIYEYKQFVYIDVSDIGRGIETKHQGTVFEPGYTTKSRGWGLGLTLARRIIRDYHNGKIEVKNSSINKGTTFRIKLKKMN
jgi:signal transduction histidine kinase